MPDITEEEVKRRGLIYLRFLQLCNGEAKSNERALQEWESQPAHIKEALFFLGGIIEGLDEGTRRYMVNYLRNRRRNHDCAKLAQAAHRK